VGVQVTFSYTTWAALFPQFSNLTSNQVTGLVLPLAEQYCRNDGGGPVTTAASQSNLLNLMVAHVAQLLFGSTTQPLSPIVGRISSATEGSVSVQADMPSNPEAAWFYQTQYGAMFWAAMAPYRTMRYFPSARRRMSPWPNQ
jgi:hypothetical protein